MSYHKNIIKINVLYPEVMSQKNIIKNNVLDHEVMSYNKNIIKTDVLYYMVMSYHEKYRVTFFTMKSCAIKNIRSDILYHEVSSCLISKI